MNKQMCGWAETVQGGAYCWYSGVRGYCREDENKCPLDKPDICKLCDKWCGNCDREGEGNSL